MTDAAYWNTGVDQVPHKTGASLVMDCRDLVDACRGLGVEIPLTHVVDVGCGTGRWAQQCQGGYVGLDIAEDAIAYAQQAGRNVVQIAGPEDIAALSLLVQVGWICCFSVFPHISRDERRAYLQAFGGLAPNLLVDIIPGDGSGSIGCWTADPDEFVTDLQRAGWTLHVPSYERVSPDHATHRYYWAKPAGDQA